MFEKFGSHFKRQVSLSAPVATVLFMVAICLILTMHEATRIWRQRSDAIVDAYKHATNLTRAVAQHAEDSVRIVDAILIGMVGRLERDERDEGAMERLRKVLRQEVAALPQVRDLFLIDKAGVSLVDANITTEPLSYADREYFRYHLQNPDRGVHISVPVRAKISNAWVLPISRRINDPDGRFAGIALAVVDLAYFQRFFDSFDVGEKASMLLATADGTLVVRRPFVENDIGRDLSHGGVFKLLSNASSGTAELKSIADGVVRIGAFRRIDAYPLAVVIAEAAEEILAPWWEVTKYELVRWLLLNAVILSLGLIVWSRTRKLDENRSLLNATLENMNQGLIVVDAKGKLPICNQRAMALLDLPQGFMAKHWSSSELIRYQMQQGEFVDTPAEIRPYLQPVLRDSRENLYERRRPNGTILEIETKPFPGGGVVRTYLDITLRKQIETELRAANERLEIMANCNGLTGLPNRRHLDQVLHAEFGRARRENAPLSLIMIDVDWFKRFNDAYGHLIGDDCLRLIAVTLKQALLRAGDFVARYGGEEFVVLLPNTALAG